MTEDDSAVYEVKFLSYIDAECVRDENMRGLIEALLDEGGPLFTTKEAALGCLQSSYDETIKHYEDDTQYTRRDKEEENAIAVMWMDESGTPGYFGMIHKRVIYNAFIPETRQ